MGVGVGKQGRKIKLKEQEVGKIEGESGWEEEGGGEKEEKEVCLSTTYPLLAIMDTYQVILYHSRIQQLCGYTPNYYCY